MLEDVGGHLGRENVVHNELAEGGQEVPPLVQLFDLSVLVLLALALQVKEIKT